MTTGIGRNRNWKNSRTAICLSAMLALSLSSTAQNTDRTRAKPPFSLTIVPKEEIVRSGQLASLTVKEKNTSGREIDLTKSSANDDSHWYLVDIRRNDAPVEKTEEMRRRETPPTGPVSAINGPFFLTLAPGEEVETTYLISRYYDMKEPGTYTITLTLEADPLHSGKNLSVKSNTITITVIPADPPSAK